MSLLAAKNSSVSEPVFSCLEEKERRERILLNSSNLPRALRESEISFPSMDGFSLFRITFMSSEGASRRKEFFASFEEASTAKISKSSRLSLLASPVFSTLRSRIRESSSFDLVRRLRAFLDEIPAREKPSAAALAVAGPVIGDAIVMMNSPWSFSVEGMRQHFGWSKLYAFHVQAGALVRG